MKTIYHQFEPVIVRWIVAAIVLALVLMIASVAAACPTCKDGLAQNDPRGQSLAAGISYSVLFMMSMPYIILGTVGSYFYLSVRRARAAQAAAAGAEPSATTLSPA